MIVFKTFFKVLSKCKMIIIMNTALLIFFGSINVSVDNTSTKFTSSKPNILIINNDKKEGITKSLIEYIESNSKVVKLNDKFNSIDDALFYRDVNYIIYIPSNFREEFLNKNNPTIEIKSTGDYQASLANIMLSKYLNIANTYNEVSTTEEALLDNINTVIKKESNIETISKLDTTSLQKATIYYNFTNYCLLAGLIYVVSLILSSFRNEKIKKRTIISSMNDKKYNMLLLLSNSLFAITLWLFYVLLSFILVGKIMFTIHGIWFIINSFIFTICALVIAFLIGNLISDKRTINGIVNVLALGCSFLCGAFIPMNLLPLWVLNISHILPSYWFIKNNNLIKEIEVFNFKTVKPILVNISVLLGFIFMFIIIVNIITRSKRKIG